MCMGLLDRLTKKNVERQMSQEGKVMYDKIMRLSPDDEAGILAMRDELAKRFQVEYDEAMETFRYNMVKPVYYGLSKLEGYGIDVERLPIDNMHFIEVYELFLVRPYTSAAMKASSNETATQFCGGWGIPRSSFVPYVTMPDGAFVDCIYGHKNKSRDGLLNDIGIKTAPLTFVRDEIAKKMDYLELSETRQMITCFTGRDFVKLIQALSVQQMNFEGMSLASGLTKRSTMTQTEIAKLSTKANELCCGYNLGEAYRIGDEMYVQNMMQAMEDEQETMKR